MRPHTGRWAAASCSAVQASTDSFPFGSGRAFRPPLAAVLSCPPALAGIVSCPPASAGVEFCLPALPGIVACLPAFCPATFEDFWGRLLGAEEPPDLRRACSLAGGGEDACCLRPVFPEPAEARGGGLLFLEPAETHVIVKSSRRHVVV